MYATSDLTPFEQKKNKALCQQLADMNEVEITSMTYPTPLKANLDCMLMIL